MNPSRVIHRTLRKHPRRTAGGTAGLIAVVITAVLLWPGSAKPTRYVPQTRARVYSGKYNACLLTDSAGIAGTAAEPVWAGMQAASATTTARISYLAMSGPQTVDNAAIYINTLVLRGCSVILAAGTIPVQGLQSRAAAFPGAHFITIGGSANTPNVKALAGGPAAAIRGEVAAAIDAQFSAR